eukprot:9154484-Prorocentrum_lima.AAC.1
MTSSLVGSEMCIRDRSIGRSVDRSVGRSVDRSVGRSVDRSIGRSVDGSVSYTHLTLPTICSV